MLLSLVLALGGGGGYSAVAAVYEVRDGDADALTNAVAQATGDGDVIQVYPGLYDLTGKAMTSSASLSLAMKSGGRLVGMGATPDETLIVGGGTNDQRRIFDFASTSSGYCSVSNLTLTGGGCTNGSGGVVYDYQRRISFADCVVSNNAAQTGGAFAGLKTPVLRCRIINNRSTEGNKRGMAFWDCREARDCLIAEHAGGTINHAQSGGYTQGVNYSNCVFTANTDGTALSSGIFTDCVFSNTTYKSGGGGVDTTFLTNCLFVCCTNINRMSGTFVGCTLKANKAEPPLLKSATLRNCVVRGNSGIVGWTAASLFAGCTFYNSLIAENFGSCQNGSGFAWGNVKFYNCTVISNRYEVKDNSVLYGSGVAVNTVFAGNMTKPKSSRTYTVEEYSIAQDFNSANLPAAMTNCVWTAMTGTYTNDFPGCKQVSADELKFTDPANGDWTLRKSAVLFDAGWSDAAYLEDVGAKDLAGVKRVRGAAIDIGAYEFDVKPGMLFIIR